LVRMVPLRVRWHKQSGNCNDSDCYTAHLHVNSLRLSCSAASQPDSHASLGHLTSLPIFEHVPQSELHRSFSSSSKRSLAFQSLTATRRPGGFCGLCTCRLHQWARRFRSARCCPGGQRHVVRLILSHLSDKPEVTLTVSRHLADLAVRSACVGRITRHSDRASTSGAWRRSLRPDP
jgi:hypothetical protein